MAKTKKLTRFLSIRSSISLCLAILLTVDCRTPTETRDPAAEWGMKSVGMASDLSFFFLNLRNVCPGFSLSKNFSTFSSSYASDAKCLPQITLFLKFTSLMFPNSILHATSQRLALSNCVCPCGKRWLVMPRLMLTSHPQTWHFGMILQIAASNLARCTQTRQDNSAQSGNGNAKC